ncbi:MAG: alpha/beta hydrolase [Rhodospirillales bacterium]|jgi:arylformamidase|nr:alpha/beta hydrolase [Rhodospirillales bacterium]
MSVYREFDLEELEVQYDIEASVDSLETYQLRYQGMSEKVVQEIGGQLDVSYGPDPLQCMDIFPASEAGSPICVFIHGGYWIRGDKGGTRFPAATFNEAGATWITINYRLARDMNLDEIISDVRQAISYIYMNAAEMNGGGERIFIAGSSAGGHLTGMLAAPGWQADHDLPDDVIKGATAISGLHDLEPFLYASQKSYLKLDADAVRRNSPIHNLPREGIPLGVVWGGKETDEFQRQSKAYAEACADAGIRLKTLFMAEQDHFSMNGELANPQSPLTRAILGVMDLG